MNGWLASWLTSDGLTDGLVVVVVDVWDDIGESDCNNEKPQSESVSDGVFFKADENVKQDNQS